MHCAAYELVYECISPVVGPVAAKPGDRIVLLLLSGAPATLTVWRKGRGIVFFDEVVYGMVYGLLLPLAVDGVIIQKNRPDFSLAVVAARQQSSA